jgi:hypothetical protein
VTVTADDAARPAAAASPAAEPFTEWCGGRLSRTVVTNGDTYWHLDGIIIAEDAAEALLNQRYELGRFVATVQEPHLPPARDDVRRFADADDTQWGKSYFEAGRVEGAAAERERIRQLAIRNGARYPHSLVVSGPLTGQGRWEPFAALLDTPEGDPQ